jgi:multidrug efflux pump subunit AcrA (membrane-fusion protein)
MEYTVLPPAAVKFEVKEYVAWFTPPTLTLVQESWARYPSTELGTEPVAATKVKPELAEAVPVFVPVPVPTAIVPGIVVVVVVVVVDVGVVVAAGMVAVVPAPVFGVSGPKVYSIVEANGSVAGNAGELISVPRVGPAIT